MTRKKTDAIVETLCEGEDAFAVCYRSAEVPIRFGTREEANLVLSGLQAWHRYGHCPPVDFEPSPRIARIFGDHEAQR